MSTDWTTGKLGDLADVTVGFVGTMAPHYTDTGVPFLRSQNVQPFRLELEDMKYVSADFDSRIAKSRLTPGDVVTVRTGKPGATAVIPAELMHANCSDLVITRPGPRLDPRWLAYYINGAASGYVASRLVGAVQQHFNVGAAKEMLLELPPLEEQRRIAATLAALDDKVVSNQNLARLIPAFVRAQVIAALAEEAESLPVASLARFVNGGAYTKDATGTGRMVLRIAELNSGPGASTVYNDIQVPNEKLARPGDLLMSWSGSLGVYRWFRDEAIINQHIFKVVPDGYPAWLVFDRLDAVMPIFQGVAKDKATTMGHIQRGHLENTHVYVPATATLSRLDEQLAPLWDRLLLAERENTRLVALRDLLLPELLSGRLRVPEAVA